MSMSDPVTEEWVRTELRCGGDDGWRVATHRSEAMATRMLCFAFKEIVGDECPRCWLQYIHPVKFGRGEIANIPLPMPRDRREALALYRAVMGSDGQ